MDSVLLAAFVSPLRGPVADLGAGCGVISALLARRGLKGPFLAVEIDPLAGECCRMNHAAASMAGQVLVHDLRQPHALLAARLSPQRLRLVHGRIGLPAKLALIEAVKDGGEELRVEPPLVVYAQGQAYTDEVAGIYRELTGASRPASGPI